MDENEKAIIGWVNTFDLDKPCDNLAQLSDGNILITIIHQMIPTHFDKDVFDKDSVNNYALAAGNLRKILRVLSEYFRSSLNKVIDMSNIDVNAIARDVDHGEILSMLELVVAVAVMCEDKAIFIPKIFELDHLSQTILKNLVEQVMGRAVDADNEETDDLKLTPKASSDNLSQQGINQAKDDEVLRANTMIEHLQVENEKLVNRLDTLLQSNQLLNNQIQQLSNESTQKQSEREINQQDNKNTIESMKTSNESLKKELDDARRDFDLKCVDENNMKAELKAMNQRMEASKEIQAKLEMENRQQGDEIDLLKGSD